MAAKYGQTWWGQQWLKSLDHIDFDNRLPRGRTYANKGAVKDIKVEGGTISARVQGSRPSPYKVTIRVPPFDKKEKEELVSRISNDPVLISRLLNGELDPALLDLAAGLGISVFPRKWSDFDMNCSCPDWAVPCKHLAAVVYKLSSEIDNNPFLVFDLHQLDLVKALKGRNIRIEAGAETRFPTVAEVLGIGEKKKAAKPTVTEEKVEQTFRQLHYSVLPDLLEPLVRILPDTPPFYVHGNFRELYEKYLKRVSRTVQNIFSGKTGLQEPEEVFTRSKRKAPPEFRLRFGDTLSLLYDENFELTITCSGETLTAAQLAAALHELPPAQLPDYDAGVAALYHLQLLALNLLNKGAVVPQLFVNAANDYRIRWLPALLDRQVRELLQQAGPNIPPGLLAFRSGKTVSPCPEEVLSLCSFFLTHFIASWSAPEKIDDITDLFFRAGPQAFSGVGEKAFPLGIAAWLSRLHLTRRQYVPVLEIEIAGPDAFALHLQVEDRSDAQSLPVPLAKVLSQKSFDQQRYAILQSVTLLGNFITGLDRYLQSGAREPIVLDPPALAAFLFDMLPAIRLLDVRTILPKALREIYRPQVSVRLTANAKNEASGFIRLDDLLQFDAQVAIGDEFLSEAEFLKLIKRSNGIVQFRNQYVYLDPKELQKLQKALQQPAKMSGVELLRTALAGDFQGAPVQMTAEVQDLIKELTDQKGTSLPAGLQARLRPYQLSGFSWMYRNTRIGFGSLIADDMGLGKTLQVITTILKFKEEGWLDQQPVLVVAPTSLLTNWSRELQRFAPSLRYRVYHGGARKLEKEEFDVLLTSYGLARSDLAVLKKQKWFAVVTDEAQNIKNNEAAQTKAVKSIPARTYIAMSGTPVENRLSEYWSIMDFANPGLLGNLPSFLKTFARPIQNEHDEKALQQFKKITAPFLLRRLKKDKSIIADLPDKVEQDQFCTLTPEQAALYETTLDKALNAINEVGEEKEQLFKRQGLVLQMIMALKQICNHPAQFLKNKKGGATDSGKSVLLLELLETITASHEKTLIFTQFTEMAEMLQGFIREKFGYEPLYLHGQQSRKQRDEVVERFQTVPHERIFILSLKAGGTGLNLTAAQNVIHYDLWWNPGVEAQATDRAYRIGQQKNVLVHRFITQGTFEERINEMIQSKKELAELSVSVGENWIGNLSGKELKNLFALTPG
ncbi:SNF2-related protein [Paraflavisolibacter sp. H34]|uniref:SNF2-related protein n=1 Tax=Huijunlia imazamoxiresistens TaxID=3127457 RepID=UPI00301810BF